MALSPAGVAAPRILLVKTSSMGDVLHNLPVVTDIRRHIPAARIDWVVEESFALLPGLHPDVEQTLTVALRRWRKGWWGSRSEIKAACAALAGAHYDKVLDTQGLVKSALVARCTRAPKYGYDRNSAREPLASLFYDHTFAVSRERHAVARNRELAARALGYALDSPADYGIRAPELDLPWLPNAPYVVFLHATSRDDKLWAEDNWIAVGRALRGSGLRAVLPWGSDGERARAERLAAAIPNALCAPRLALTEAATLLARSRGAVGVDTGLSHLAVALDVPTVGLYVATDPGLTGLYAAERAINLGGKDHTPTVDEVLTALGEAGVHA